jgi:hypothetical protein
MVYFHMLALLSTLFGILSLLYIVKTIRLILLIFQLNTSMTGVNNLDYVFLQYIPLLLILPCISSIAAAIFFHSSLKIRQPTPLSFILSVLFILLIPFPFWYIGNLNITPIVPGFFRTFWQDETIILACLLLVMLIIVRKRFSSEGKPLEKISRLILLLFFTIFTLPVLIGAEYMFFKSKNPDYKFAETQKQSGFYIYQPEYLPSGRNFETTFFIPKKGLVPLYKTVEFHINYPMAEIIQGKKSGLIIVKQSKIDKNFDLKKFIDSSEKEIKDVKSDKLEISKDGRISFKSIKNAWYLYFVTKKNTLVKISAFYITKDDILKFTRSLK